MEVTSIITIMFLFASIVILFIMYIRKKTKCPPCSKQDYMDEMDKKTIRRITPELDVQFSESNLPSKVYEDVFKNDNIWIGGMSFRYGRGSNNKKRL